MTPSQARRREQMPICAAFVDQLRAVFGADQVRVLYCEEGGAAWGEPAEHAPESRVEAQP